MSKQLNLYVRISKHLLKHTIKARKIERAEKVLTYIRCHEPIVKILFYEKIFTVDAVLNLHNDRYITSARNEVKDIFKTNHLSQVMVFEVVASNGKKMLLHFINPVENVNTEVNYKVLRYKDIKLRLKTNYSVGNYVWTQGGAPAHTI